MRERVSINNGTNPIILVAPHGNNDINTGFIADQASRFLRCNAVINYGFDRSEYVDVNTDKADCNRIDHVLQNVVYDEFLKPILKIRNRIKKKFAWGGTYPKVLIFYLHGIGDDIHKAAKEPVELVVGYGRGAKRDSFTCKLWRKNLFLDLWRIEAGDTAQLYEGAGDGKYAGRSSNNLNQYFRKHEMDRMVESMQLEIPYCKRLSKSAARCTAAMLGKVLSQFMQFDSYDIESDYPFI